MVPGDLLEYRKLQRSACMAACLTPSARWPGRKCGLHWVDGEKREHGHYLRLKYSRLKWSLVIKGERSVWRAERETGWLRSWRSMGLLHIKGQRCSRGRAAFMGHFLKCTFLLVLPFFAFFSM